MRHSYEVLREADRLGWTAPLYPPAMIASLALFLISIAGLAANMANSIGSADAQQGKILFELRLFVRRLLLLLCHCANRLVVLLGCLAVLRLHWLIVLLLHVLLIVMRLCLVVLLLLLLPGLGRRFCRLGLLPHRSSRSEPGCITVVVGKAS